MNRRLIWGTVCCLVIGLASCGGKSAAAPAASGGDDGFGGRGGGSAGNTDAEAGAGSAGAAAAGNSDAAGAAGTTASAGAAGAAGDSSDAGSGGVSVTCSFSTLPAAPAPVDPSASFEERAEGDTLAILDENIGRYLRGDVLVYRGTANAHSNGGVIGAVAQDPKFSDETLADGPVLASLEFRPLSPYDYSPSNPAASGDAAFLFLNSPLAHEHVLLSQALAQPSMTEASDLIADDGPVFNFVTGLVSACTSCAPKFWSRPAAIVLDNLTTTGEYYAVPPSGPAVAVTLHTFVSARLAVAAPCSLTYDDLGVLNNMTSFHLEGGELVWHSAATLEPPHSLADGCWFNQPYTLDAFIDPSDLSHYGVRNFKLGTPVRECIAV